jgi:hypothetical protein
MERITSRVLAVFAVVAVASLFTVCKASGANNTVYQVDTGEQVEPRDYSHDLMVKFGVKTAPYGLSSITAQNVTDTFSAVSEYLNGIAVADLVGANPAVSLGDYIDLPALSVEAYPEGQGAINILITPKPLPFAGYQGTLLRLIVVGRNSFNGINGNGVSAHLVFQFQNLPGTHRMNGELDGDDKALFSIDEDEIPEEETGNSGYADSEMRDYLRNIKGPVVAGVPVSLLWAPKRAVAHSYDDESIDDADSIFDNLWLPTVMELTGNESNSPLSETAENQARLEYYTGNDKLIKYDASGNPANWWSASPGGEGSFRHGNGANGPMTGSAPAQTELGFAPAFCVRGTVEEEQEGGMRNEGDKR